MRLNVMIYRVMAYVTGVVLIILCALAVMQVSGAGGLVNTLVHVVGFTHGMLYIVYLLAGYTLSRRLRLRPWPTVAVLLAGTIPVMTFVVERSITHRYIEPAMARGGADPGSLPASGPQGGVSDAEPVPPR